ncbi:MAG: GNAT family N-acetyltransferase [Caldilineae bacterium]|nr:MAG: GNAT family N-acetyltransferase [Caldilineae bacterium]
MLTLRPLDPARWEAFVNAHPQALLFHTPAWLDFLAEVYGLQWHPLGIWRGEALVGVFPLLTRRLGPFRLAGSPLMQVIASTPFLGPLVAPSLLPDALLAVRAFARRRKIDHLEMAFPFLLAEERQAKGLGFGVETCRAVVLSLAGKTTAQLWGELSAACRRAVRKAEANGVEIVEATDAGIVEEYYRMCEEVYRDAGRPPHLSRKFYRLLWERFAGTETLKVRLAKRGGQLLAGAMFLLHRRTAYYLSGASYRAGLPFRPNNLLQWRFIVWAAGRGYHRYDMGGAVVPGITRFKLSFGGTLHPYTRLYRAGSPLAWLGRAAYRRLIPLWRWGQARRTA